MLINELGWAADGIEKDREGVEPAYHATELDAVNEVDGDADVFLAYLIQKDVLQIELRLVHQSVNLQKIGFKRK